MFEKFSNLDVDSAGRGGEYTVQVSLDMFSSPQLFRALYSSSLHVLVLIFQAGFGWTNGVVLWVASNYGGQLVAPSCPNLLSTSASSGTSAAVTIIPPRAMSILATLAAMIIVSAFHNL